MVCRAPIVACLLLALAAAVAQAEVEPALEPETAEAGSHAAPHAAGTVEESDLSHLPIYEGSSGGFLPPVAYDYFFQPYYARADALFLQRTNGATAQTVVQTNGGGTPVVTTGDFGFSMVAGPRILVGKRIDTGSALEGSYFGTQFWNSTITPSDPGNLDLPGAVGLAAADFNQADNMSLAYKSEIHNAELNYVRLGGDVAFLAGFRYLNWVESFDIRSQKNTNHSVYDLSTSNNLVGGQLGARACWLGQHVDWELCGKAGLFGNNASQRQTLTNSNNTIVLRNANSSGSEFSFVGDVNLNATWRLNQTWQVQAGYNVMLITGLALAPNQLDFSNNASSGTHLDRQSTLFLHGVNLGIGTRW
jgi:hypothetical protein